jgi:hypothetical protein
MSYCYILFTADLRQTYIGATVDPNRRLRQHNQELVGGARRTKGHVWKRALYVGGFPDWTATLQFEWSWKRHGRGKFGLAGKLLALLDLLQSEKSTSTATPFRFWTEKISIHPDPVAVHIMEKIEGFRKLVSICGCSRTNLLPFFTFPSSFFSSSFPSFPKTMSAPSVTDITSLALQVEELSTTIAQLTARLDAALGVGTTLSTPVKKRKTKASVETNEILPNDAPKKKRGPKKAKVEAVPMASLDATTAITAIPAIPAIPAEKTEKVKKVKVDKVKAVCPVVAEGVLRFNKSVGDAPLKELSNYFMSEITLDGVAYKTVESYLQSEKYATTDAEYAQKIRDQKNSALLRGMAKSKAHTARADWEDVKVDILRKGLKAKFVGALATVLLGTGSATLEQESVDDAFWGIGADGKGLNTTGKLLMELRAELSV